MVFVQNVVKAQIKSINIMDGQLMIFPFVVRYFTECFESIRPRGHRTIRYEQYLYEHGKNRTLKDVALEYQVKYTTLRWLWFRYAGEALDNRAVQYPRKMGIDEFSVAKRHKYRAVVTDLEQHRVVTTLAGRDMDGLKELLDSS